MGLTRFSGANPLTARTVLEHGAEGKGGQAADTFEDAGVITAGCSCSGSTHEFCYRAVSSLVAAAARLEAQLGPLIPAN